MRFDEFLIAAGLLPRDVLRDGKWRRCGTETHPKKRNGSYKLAVDGLIGWCQNFELHSEPLTWRPDKAHEAPKVDVDAIARKRAAERQALIRATQAARQFYLDCKPLRDSHPYLDSHGLSMAGCFGLKVDALGWLVVPVLLNRSLTSVQRISPTGEKLFWPGASVKGASYTVDRPHASITVICEGLATGLAIFAAAPLTRIVVAFNAGNLARVRAPAGMVVMAADNDHATEARIGTNPGVLGAQEAAEALGCGVAAPTGIVGTDWCDYRLETITARLAARGKERDVGLARAVDAEIAAAMMRHARLVRSEVFA